MNKQEIVDKIITKLEKELELYRRAARAAFEEATDEQSKAENKYDTRGLEASYLARGQARQVADTEEALGQLRALALVSFGSQPAIAAWTLVELENRAGREWYFLANCAGGTEIRMADQDVLVITPQSPLGSQLLGKKAGDVVTMTIAGKKQRQNVVSVS